VAELGWRHQLGRLFSSVRLHANQKFVQDRAESIKVRAMMGVARVSSSGAATPSGVSGIRAAVEASSAEIA
jgi:hypothetical protein